MASRLLAWLTALITVVLSGCSTTGTTPARADFAPTYPMASEQPAPANGGLYHPGHGMNLFYDSKAYRVGDLLTIILQESTNAQKQATTASSKDQSIEFDVPTVFGAPVTRNGQEILGVDVSQGNSFSGKGSSSQSNSLSGNITVFVAQVLPNGNLVVRGEKQLTLNQGSEYVRFSGIVRPSDVKPDNTVVSTRVANAEILYSGEGTLADANRMGWLARFFNSPWWPF